MINKIKNPRWFIENMLVITNKVGKQVPFKLNEEQSKLMDHIEICLANDLPIRMIVLKARQIGSTTFFSAFGFWLAAMNMNKAYGIVAHRLDSAKSIYEKCKMYLNNLEKEMQPQTIQNSSEGINFNTKEGRGINSKIMFSTVSEGVFRGQTLTFLHLTECAFWEGDIQAIENSIAPTIPYEAGTAIARESTANGYNAFKDDWDSAIRGDNGYTPFFFGWQDHKEYSLKMPVGFIKTREEEDLQERFKLTDDQIFWRRSTIDRDYKGNIEWFRQEYPMTPAEAFVTSGASVFDSESLVKGLDGVVEPVEVKLKSYETFERLLVWEEAKIEEEKVYATNMVWSFEKQEYEEIPTELLLDTYYYETPYTIGIDTSGMGADKNQIVVIDNITKNMVARYEKKDINEEYLAMLAVEIAKMYNNAMIVPEVNYSHEITKYIMDDRHCGYKNVYIRENITRMDQAISSLEYGWKTTTATKPAMISHLRSMVNANPETIKDEGFWREAEYFIIHDVQKNIMGAATGKHDDIIIATAIAMYVSSSMQSKQTLKRVRGKNENEDSFLVKRLKEEYRPRNKQIRRGIYKNNA